VLIDFFKAFADYQVHERIRLTYVTDATILIVLREITVLIYSHEFETETLLVFAALLLVLGIVRGIAVRFPASGNVNVKSLEMDRKSGEE
jgi:uncharacterized membrane protein (DUF373 family)